MTALRKIDAHIWARNSHDWYVEPTWCSERLFQVEPFVGAIWEPACGPLEVFIVRCRARALLFEAAEFDFYEAVDVLQEAAVATGLVDSIGQDEVQRIIATAFAPADPVDVIDQREEDDDEYGGLSFTFAQACMLADAGHLVKQGDPQGLNAWLMQRSESERVWIIDRLRNSPT
jgi:hypothetical protein